MLNPQEKLQQDCGGTTNIHAVFHRGLEKDLGSSLTQSACDDYAAADGKQQHSAAQVGVERDWMPWKGDKTFPNEVLDLTTPVACCRC